jgi:hypothetical protein
LPAPEGRLYGAGSIHRPFKMGAKNDAAVYLYTGCLYVTVR